MTLRHLAEGLRCPFCFSSHAENRPLSPVAELVLGCDVGHRVDVNKRGYVSLLPPASRMIGDSQAMLDARTRFFETGSYVRIADAVASACVTAQASQHIECANTGTESDGGRAVRLAELGCGTGYYLRTASDALRSVGAVVEPVAADLSPAAVRTAVRAVPESAGVVLDVWQPLPFLSHSLSGIVSVFAPRNLPEFARVLSPGGFLVAVVPTTRHLQELRAEGRALDIPDGKPDALAESAAPWFREAERTLVDFEMSLDPLAVDNLIGMGPSSHHRVTAEENDAQGPETASTRVVTASVTVQTFVLLAGV